MGDNVRVSLGLITEEDCKTYLAAIFENLVSPAPAEERDATETAVKDCEEDRADVAIRRARVDGSLRLRVARFCAADYGENNATSG